MRIDKNKYSRLRGVAPMIAERVGCSQDYVCKVLRGYREPKTANALLAIDVLKIADSLLEALNQKPIKS